MHEVRSGYDLPWTHGPLKFDNSYYKHLMELEWKKRDWHGKDMFTDVATGRLGMLPTDMALKTDPSFRQYAQLYARDEKQFFHDFAWAYAKLISLGCPPECDPTSQDPPASELNRLSAEFRDYAMHGSIAPCKTLAKSGKVDVHQVEPTSGRTALHKAAFCAHLELCRFLLHECKIDPNVQDIYGDTALHDTARFGNVDVARLLAELTGTICLFTPVLKMLSQLRMIAEQLRCNAVNKRTLVQHITGEESESMTASFNRLQV